MNERRLFFITRTLWGLVGVLFTPRESVSEHDKGFTPLADDLLEEFLSQVRAEPNDMDIKFLTAYSEHLHSLGIEVPRALGKFIEEHRQRWDRTEQ